VHARSTARSLPFALAWVAVLLATGPTARAADETLLASEWQGQLPAVEEGVLVVDGMRGRISVRPGADRDLRFVSVSPEDRKSPLPVDLVQAGRELIVRPPQGAEGTARLFEAIVPLGMRVVVRATDAQVVSASLRDRLEVSGERLEVDVRSHTGALSLDLRGGRVRARDVEGEFHATLAGSETELVGASGPVFAEVEGGSLRLAEASSDVDVEAADANVRIEGSAMPVRVRLRGGRLQAKGLETGGTLASSGGAIEVEQSKGVLDVETDSAVVFRELESEVHVNSYGGSLEGEGNQGLLEIVTEASRVRLAKILGPVRVQGDALEVDLEAVGGETIVLATSSKVRVRRVDAELTVHNEYGDIDVDGASKKVEVRSRDGAVSLRNLNETVDIEADGAEVVVSWAALNFKDEARVVNAGGDVVVGLPSRAEGSVEGSARFGRVDNEIPDLEDAVTDSSVSGNLGRGRGPRIAIEADGDLRLVPSGELARDE